MSFRAPPFRVPRPLGRLPGAGAAASVATPATKLRRTGPGSLEAAELLAVAGGMPLAASRALLDACAGLAGLAGHDPVEMRRIGAISQARAARLAAAFEIGRRVAEASAEPDWQVRAPSDVGERMSRAMGHLQHEELRVLLLTTKNVVTGVVRVYAGNLAGSSVRVGEVFRDAVRRQAAAIVVVHNHPSGDPSPSPDDVRITAELADAGRLLDIELLDHVVVASRGWVSLRALGTGWDQPSTTTR